MYRRLVTPLVLAALLAAPLAAGASSKLPPQPKAPKRTVFNTYWGEKVADDYQYMEDAADRGAAQWAKEQNAYARAWLNRHPERKAILERVVALTHSDSPDYYGMSYRNGYYFALKDEPPKQQPFLVALTSVADLKTERVLVDPNAVDPTGATSIDFYVPSLDGKRVAVSLSKNGTEDGTLYFYETATGRRLDDAIPNPVLMRVSYDWGHGIGTALSERDQQTADVMMFLFDRLGVRYRPVARDGKTGRPVPSL